MLTYDLTARGRKTMYEYLYEAMKADILSGRLTAGEKLPSKRAFAGHLQVSVKTVENTYEQLLLEGYIRSEEKRGYFVNRLEVKNTAAPAYASFVTRFREEEYLADLTANNIQYDKFPFATWAKIMRQTLTDYDTSLLKTVPFNGVEKLRVAIAEHLYRYRGMQVSPDHIIVGAGTEYLYSRLLQLLGKNAKFGVENPGYRKITKLYEVGGVAWDYVDIDGQGMKVEQLKQRALLWRMCRRNTISPSDWSCRWEDGRSCFAGRRRSRSVISWRMISTVSSAWWADLSLPCSPWIGITELSISILFPKLWYRLYVSAIWCCRRS